VLKKNPGLPGFWEGICCYIFLLADLAALPQFPQVVWQRDHLTAGYHLNRIKTGSEGKHRSTPMPLDIFLTVKDSLSPPF
jgi:hypothetical protein